MLRKPILAATAVMCTTALLAGCFSDRPGTVPRVPNTNTPPPPATAPDKFSVGGTVTGLGAGSVVLATTGGTVTVNANGSFVILTGVDEGDAYAVSVSQQPTTPHQVCAVANGSGTVTADVTDIVVTCDNAVQLNAQVTDQPIAFASVSVTVGDRSYTTVADENGFFSIVIPVLSGTGEQMVVAEAQGVDAQSHVTFANLLGTLEALAGHADESGEIDSDTDSSVNVTNVSTARYVLVVQANGGELPADSDALQTAERSVNATDMLNLAAAIKLIVDDPDNFELPAGKSSILEFASDPAAVQSFIDAAPAEALEQALTEILADTSLVPGYKAADVPGIYFAIPAAEPGFLSPQGSGLVFDEDGSGEFLTSGAGGFPVTATFGWEVIDGIVKVRYDHPVTTQAVVSLEETGATEAQQQAIGACQGIFQVNAAFTVTEREYSLLSSGSLVDQVRVTTLTEIEYEPVSVNTECDASGVVQIAAPVPTVAESTTEIWKASELPEQPFTAEEVIGSEWGIYMLVPVGPFSGDEVETVLFANQLVEFNADGTAHADGGDDAGIDLTWEINEFGDLKLAYGEWTQELTKLQISGDAVKTVMLFENTADETQRFAYFDLAVRKNDGLLADGAQALWLNDEGEFWHAYTNGWFPSAWDGDEPVFGAGAMTFGWSFSADNEAWNHQFFYEPYDYANDFVNDGIERQSAWHREMVWEMDEASEEDGWIGFYGPYTNGCYPSTICFRRDWLPLGVNEAGYMYVQEVVHSTPDNGTTWELWIAPRITPVRAVPFPETEQEGTTEYVPID